MRKYWRSVKKLVNNRFDAEERPINNLHLKLSLILANKLEKVKHGSEIVLLPLVLTDKTVVIFRDKFEICNSS